MYTTLRFGLLIIFVTTTTFVGSLHAQWQTATTSALPAINHLTVLNNTVWASTSRGVWRSADNGTTWQEAGLAQCAISKILSVGNNNILLAIGSSLWSDDKLYRSTDGGITWNVLTTNLPQLAPNAIAYIVDILPRGASLYLTFDGIEGRGVYRSDDNGITWSKTHSGDSPFPSGVSKLWANDKFLFIASRIGITRSNDEGKTWIAVNEGLPSNRETPPFVINDISENNGILYAATTLGLYQSHDNGSKWAPAHNGLPTLPPLSLPAVLTLEPNSNTVFASVNGSFTSDSYLFISDNDGKWRNISEGLPHSTFIVDLIVNNGFVLAATLQQGVWRRRLAELHTSTSVGNASDPTFGIIGIQPNPAAEQASVRIAIPSAQFVRLSVCNLLGQELFVVQEGQTTPGTSLVQLPTASLSSGTYFVRLQTEHLNALQRLVVVQ